MAGMSGKHRTSARLGHIADQNTRPADRTRVSRELLQIGNEAWMPPVTVARETHHLPIPSVHRKGHCAGKTASRVSSDCLHGERGRGGRRAEERFSWHFRVRARRSEKRSKFPQVLSRGDAAAETEHYAENPPQVHVWNPRDRAL